MQSGKIAGGQAERSTTARVKAVDRAWSEVESGQADRALTREAFKDMLWKSGEPSNVRVRVVEKLVSDSTPEDIADTRNLIRLRLPTETDWAVLGAMCKGAADQGWSDVTPGLIRSFARPVPEPTDDQRPERMALERLHPGKAVEQVAFEAFTTPAEGEAGERLRRDAWELLARLDRDGSMRAELLAADSGGGDSTDPMLDDLRALAATFGVVPITSMELEWARALRKPEHAAWWSETAARCQGLTAAQRQGLGLRHLEAVRLAEDAMLQRDREDLLAEVERRVKARKRHNRTEGAADYTKPETIQAWGKSLQWGDALSMLVIDDALRAPGVLTELHTQIAHDRQDTSTEYGGILQARGPTGSSGAAGEIDAIGFQPRPVQRVGDTRFVAPEEMIRASDVALAHYHFHSQRARNEAYAGPGPGDIEFAARSGRSCVVFTSIDERTINVDFYIRGGAVIDLGDLK